MIGAIVLAAGRSQRMGTQKLLLPLGGRPLIAGVVDAVQRSSVSEIVVVVGRDAEPLQSALAGRSVRFVANPDADGDMLSSVRCGWRALPEACAGVLVVLGDQPGVSAGLIESLRREFLRKGGGIVLPQHGGHRGHPLILAAKYRAEVLLRHDGVGLRGLLAAHPLELGGVEIASADVLADVDTPEDYERWRKRSAE